MTTPFMQHDPQQPHDPRRRSTTATFDDLLARLDDERYRRTVDASAFISDVMSSLQKTYPRNPNGFDTSQFLSIAENVLLGEDAAAAADVGVPENRRGQWSREEHQKYVEGMRLHPGKWKVISKEFVPTRTGRQIASHHQKFQMGAAGTWTKRGRKPKNR